MDSKKLLVNLLRIVLLSYLCFGIFVVNEIFLGSQDFTLPNWGRFIMSFFILIIPIISLIISIYLIIKLKTRTLNLKEKLAVFLPWFYVLFILLYTIWGLNQDYPR
jgi:hypothetical protein